jgi:hypothetical protein
MLGRRLWRLGARGFRTTHAEPNQTVRSKPLRIETNRTSWQKKTACVPSVRRRETNGRKLTRERDSANAGHFTSPCILMGRRSSPGRHSRQTASVPAELGSLCSGQKETGRMWCARSQRIPERALEPPSVRIHRLILHHEQRFFHGTIKGTEPYL